MSWISFIVIVLIVYIVYYAANIAYDIFLASKKQMETSDSLLIEGVSPTITPKTIDDGFEDEEKTTNKNDEQPEENPKTKPVSESATRKKEVPDPGQSEKNSEIPDTEDSIAQSSGGVTLKGLISLCREKAIIESQKFDFAT
ncbi:hypothetical protein [Sunxiuqinia elliptica]|jgi:hypothetical protein|uniref:Uncharacterized protein n=1 Tax=Sunxiuqinia elliptica TaxID=655355 RepID=A0A4R6H0D7_9BACT|nr:hypothetical protein [Sunxiuqinia elliptica]TDO01410.1 hypothetical protein DET52_105269 [Sunxiuqinia elliptica]TDO57921.1 hypothetical protein DET65_3518 [Sunxiuqinia elliptica]